LFNVPIFNETELKPLFTIFLECFKCFEINSENIVLWTQFSDKEHRIQSSWINQKKSIFLLERLISLILIDKISYLSIVWRCTLTGTQTWCWRLAVELMSIYAWWIRPYWITTATQMKSSWFTWCCGGLRSYYSRLTTCIFLLKIFNDFTCCGFILD
jgi:hypothetical protein